MIFKILGRVLGKFFTGVGRTFFGLFRWIGRHEAVLGMVTVTVVVVLGVWLLLNLLNVNIVFGNPQAVPASRVAVATPAPTATPLAVVSRTNAPATTEAFMVGRINGNADQLWDAMSASFHNRLAGMGIDKTALQKSFDTAKQQGTLFDSYRYIGGVPTDNGSIQFYVLNVVDTNKKVVTVPVDFTLDKDGKIISSNTDLLF